MMPDSIHSPPINDSLAAGERNAVRTVSIVRITIQIATLIVAGLCIPAFLFLGHAYLKSGVWQGGPGIGGIGVLFLAVIPVVPAAIGLLLSIVALVFSLACDRPRSWLRIIAWTMFVTWFLTAFAAICFLVRLNS